MEPEQCRKMNRAKKRGECTPQTELHDGNHKGNEKNVYHASLAVRSSCRRLPMKYHKRVTPSRRKSQAEEHNAERNKGCGCKTMNSPAQLWQLQPRNHSLNIHQLKAKIADESVRMQFFETELLVLGGFERKLWWSWTGIMPASNDRNHSSSNFRGAKHGRNRKKLQNLSEIPPAEIPRLAK